jgi:hypothetical protein
MTTAKQRLSDKRDLLKVSAKRASTLAKAERKIADNQHEVAHHLENLADELAVQVTNIEAEIHTVDVAAVDA